MVTSEKGKQLIKFFEGCRLIAYRCPAGVPTIGYGHTKGVKMGMKISQAEADKFLEDDLKPFEAVLNKLGINFMQNQFDAIVSWMFNLGAGNFASSTLKKRIVANAGDMAIAEQIVKWVNAGGKPMLGLKKRRVAEANMFVGREAFYIDMAGNIKKR